MGRVAVAGVVALGLLLGASDAAATNSLSEIVYVAGSPGGDAVYGYNAASKGLASPIREADNPDPTDTNSFWDPWSLAFDSSGNLYVQSFLSDASTFVFAPNPKRGVRPIRIFMLYGPDSQGIGVDSKGYEYVLSGDSCCFLAVGPPRAAGTPNDLYYVQPVRTIGVGFAYPPWPGTVAIADGRNPVVVVGDTVETYQGGATGSQFPLRVIQGRATGLRGQLGITVSGGLLYVTSSTATSTTHISEFALDANGNVKPIRVINGSGTGLSGKMITGIAVSARTGDIYAMVKPSQDTGPAKIEVFARLARGDTAPIRTFTDRTSKFADAEGIAIHAS